MSGTILVADDSQNIRDMLQLSLETLGYNVVVAEDGERALEHISSTSPDLLIVDVMMPKINGFQLCRRVKSSPKTRDVPASRAKLGAKAGVIISARRPSQTTSTACFTTGSLEWRRDSRDVSTIRSSRPARVRGGSRRCVRNRSTTKGSRGSPTGLGKI